MSQSTPSSIGDDAERRIEAVAEEYLAELQAGTRPDLAAFLAAHADIAEPLAKRLALVERLFKAARAVDGRRFPVERARRLKCPHCGNQIQLVEPRPKEITCVNCGSSFRVEPGTTTTYRAAGPGGTIGRFEIAELLGRGAFGEVYKAHDPKLDRDVALKIPRADTFATREEEERFVREARSCARLVHPGIVQVHEVARDGNLPYIVSDYIEGLTLADLLTGGRPGFRDSAEILAQLADALDYAHRQGVVHRDVKPSNILLSRSDGGKYRPHLTDFGLARRDEGEITITLDGQVLGTPAYMSPEQAVGDHAKIDGRSDVYSVGVVLYELLTGDLPFRGNKRMLLHQVLHDDPRPPRRLNDRIPRDLETICLKAMSKDISRRYGSAGDFANDLRRWLNGDAIRARPVGRAEKVWRWGKRNRALASLAILLLLAMAVGTAISSFFAVRADRTASRLAVEKDRSDDHLTQARRNLYINRMNLARVAWEKGDVARVTELLEPYAEPEPNEPDLRGWEWYYQQRLCHDELRRFVASPGSADSAFSADFTFTPSGERIVLISAAKDEQFVQIFDVATGRIVKKVTIEGPSNIPFNTGAIAISPDGRLLTFGENDGDVGLFDSSSGRRLGTLKGHTGYVSDVAFSPDSRLLLSGGKDGTARLWDVETRTERNKIDLRDEDKGSSRDLVHHVKWSPSGQQIGFCDTRRVAVWNVDPLMELFQMDTEFMFFSFCFSPDGMRIAVARHEFSLAHGTAIAEVWDLKSHTKVCTYQPEPDAAEPFVALFPTVAYSPTGDHVVWGVGNSLRIWDAHTGREIRVLRGHAGPVQLVAYSPDGSLIASLALAGDLRLWSSRAEPESRPLIRCSPIERNLFAFSPRRERIVTGVTPEQHRVDRLSSEGYAATIWDLGTWQPVAHIGPSGGYIRSVACSHDGKYIATASEKGVVKLWHARSGDFAKAVPTPGISIVQHVAFIAEGGRLATIQRDGLVRIWDIEANRTAIEFATHADGVRSLALDKAGRRLATFGYDGFAKIWDLENGAALLSIRVHEVTQPMSSKEGVFGGVDVIAFTPDGKVLITADRDPQAWDTTTGKLLRTFRGHSSPWREFDEGSGFKPGLAISPDGNRLATCSFEDNTVKVSDMLTGEEVRTLEAGAMPTAVAFSPDGSILATSSQDGIMLWNARPMTHDVEVERNARAVVDFAYERLPLKEEAIEFIRSNRMISDPVRQKALEFAEVYSFPPDDGDSYLRASDEEADRLNVAAWKIGALPYQPPASYRLALRWATVARELDESADFGSWSSRSTTPSPLGVAQYRVGLYEQALATLLEHDESNFHSQRGAEGMPEDLAFIAMAQWHLGKRDEARRTLRRLRESLQEMRGWDEDDVSPEPEERVRVLEEQDRFLREAEWLIEGDDLPASQRVAYWRALAVLYSTAPSMDDLRQALAVLEESTAATPDLFESQYYKALCLDRLGRTADALAAYNGVLEHSEHSHEHTGALLQSSLALMKLGMRDDAIARVSASIELIDDRSRREYWFESRMDAALRTKNYDWADACLTAYHSRAGAEPLASDAYGPVLAALRDGEAGRELLAEWCKLRFDASTRRTVVPFDDAPSILKRLSSALPGDGVVGRLIKVFDSYTTNPAVVVESVSAKTWADAGHLQPDDLIIDINGSATATVKDFKAAVAEAFRSGRERCDVGTDRDGERLMLSVDFSKIVVLEGREWLLMDAEDPRRNAACRLVIVNASVHKRNFSEPQRACRRVQRAYRAKSQLRQHSLGEMPDDFCWLWAAKQFDVLVRLDTDGNIYGQRRSFLLYDAACVWSMASAEVLAKHAAEAESVATDCKKRAIELLRDAVSAGFNDIARIRQDGDLEAIRHMTEFQAILQSIKEGAE